MACKKEACPIATWRCDQEYCVGLRKNYVNQWRLRPRQNETERQRSFNRKPALSTPICEYLGPSPTLCHSTLRSFRVIKRKRKEADYIFYASALLSFFFNTNTHVSIAFFSSPARSKYLSLFSLSFSMTNSSSLVNCRIHRLNECPGHDTKQSDGEVPVIPGALGNTEHPFIAIAPRSARALSMD